MELKIKKLNVNLGENHIIKNLDIHVEKQEFIGIIGPNGSGKSTILRTIYRAIKPKSGIIKINGKNMNAISLKETAKEMAVVSQHNEQDFNFTVLDMVLIGRSPHKKFLERDSLDDFKIAKESLKKVEMEDFIDRNYNTLSGGEKQRIILARALAQETNCLILDEPTNHLDIKYQLQFMSIAKSLNVTVIAAIHDLNMAALFCDQIYVLDEGEIIEYGTPKQVIREDLIKSLYGVNSKIINDVEDDSINIIYKPF